MNQDIHAFLKKMLEDSGQTDLTPALEEQMIADLNTRLEDRLILTAMENLSEADQDTLGKMAEDKATSKQMEEFVQTHVPNWEEVFAAALGDFRDTYLGK